MKSVVLTLMKFLGKVMDKSIAYYFEKYISLILSLFVSVISYTNKTSFLVITLPDFSDKLITICTTLFGFLLTVLTLIVQSNSETILTMKRHGSYKRLIKFNRRIIILSALVCLLSIVLGVILKNVSPPINNVLLLLCNINLFLFLWSVFDTIVFVLLFYKILLSDSSV